VTAEALEQSVLESKDKEQLSAIAEAFGVKASRSPEEGGHHRSDPRQDTGALPAEAAPAAQAAPAVEESATLFGDDSGVAAAPDSLATSAPARVTPPAADTSAAVPEIVLGPDGEPLAEWEIELMRSGEPVDAGPTTTNGSSAVRSSSRQPRQPQQPPTARATAPAAEARATAPAATADDEANDGAPEGDAADRFDADGDAETRSSRRRRRRRGKGPRDETSDATGQHRTVPRSTATSTCATRATASCGSTTTSPTRRRVHPGQAVPPVRTAQGRPRHGDQPAGRPQREEPGTARDPHGQRSTPRRPSAAAVRGPHGAVPRFSAAHRGPSDPTNMTARIIDLVARSARASAASSCRRPRPARPR
jgi:hypothetical protein